MIDYFELLGTISQKYNIRRGIQEREESWMARVIYSFLGQTGYSSLWDIQEDLQPASIVHFRTRIEKALESILDIYPEMISAFPLEHEQLSDEIRRVFIDSGMVYHSPYRLIVPPRRTAIGFNNIYFRGNTISEKCWLSGLGCYYPIQQEKEEKSILFTEMFQLKKPTLAEIWRTVVSQAQWSEYSLTMDFQYLLLKPPFRYGYWIDKPDLDGTVSLARQRLPGSDLYYLYRSEGKTVLLSQLPNWMTSDNSYRTLSNACLSVENSLPPSTYKTDGDIVHLHIAYLYPPEEMSVIRLLSWPNDFTSYPQDFNRVMSTSVFRDVRKAFEISGYQFVEE